MSREEFIQKIRAAAEEAGVFESVRAEGERLVCVADGAAEHAEYRVTFDGETVWVSLATKDRWLSESIEADLMHTGDSLVELLEEEMIDLGYEGTEPSFEHFRSDEMEFTFRTAVPGVGPEPTPADAERAGQVLLGYEATFRQLGDMSEDED